MKTQPTTEVDNLCRYLKQHNGAFVIIDVKAAPDFFRIIRDATRQTGQAAKWYTNKLFRST